VSDLLARFADVRHDSRDRVLVHLPGAAAGWSADELWHAHERYAESLTRTGVGSGELVISAAGNSPASVPFLLACRAVDAVVMPVETGTTLLELLALAGRLGAAALLLPETTAPDPRLDVQSATALDAGLRIFPTVDIERRSYLGGAMIKLTSGSTGVPKATVTTDAQLIADGTQIMTAMQIRPSDVQIAAIPLSHSYGLGCVLLPLMLQGTAFVLHGSFVPQQLPADVRQFNARVFCGVPFMFEYFLANPLTDGWPSPLRRLMSAGAPLVPSTVRSFHERYGLKIHSFYGTSETGGIAFDDDDQIDDSGTVGRPLPGVTVTLRDDDGVSGRIHVRSAAVANGYTEGGDAFVDGGYLTGDYGSWDSRGRLTLTGRVSSFVNVAGRKVQPAEVEQVLRSMPGIADARVIAAADPRRGEQIVACVVAEQGAVAMPLAVRRFCASRLAPHKIPRAIIFVDAIPLTPRGKTDRAALDGLVRSRLGV